MIAAHLSEPVERILHCATGLVFERGVQAQRILGVTPGYHAYSAPDLWRLDGDKTGQSSSLSEIRSRLDLRIVGVTMEDAHWRSRHFVAPSTEGALLEMIAQRSRDLSFEFDRERREGATAVWYMMESVLYHVSRLIAAYREAIELGRDGPEEYWCADFM